MTNYSKPEKSLGWSSSEEERVGASSPDFLGALCLSLHVNRVDAEQRLSQWVSAGFQERLVRRYFGASTLGDGRGSADLIGPERRRTHLESKYHGGTTAL